MNNGHKYKLLTLDGEYEQELTFVKREGAKFPGNTGSHPGTNLQSVLRSCISRIEYLQGQFWCLENVFIRRLVIWAVWLLEFRAARRHGFLYGHGPRFAVTSMMCAKCGHTVCNCWAA